MSISVKNISLSIGEVISDKFKIKIDNALYHLDNFVLEQKLMCPCRLTFTMFKDPVEDINEPQFSICSSIIGQELKLTLKTETMETEFANGSDGEKTDDIEFEGFIACANSKRMESIQHIQVEAVSKDAVLMDHPKCQIFNEEKLADIVKEIYEVAGLDNKEVMPENEDAIFYTTQYNETNYDFLRRLARRHCEWFFSTGKELHFGRLNGSRSIQLSYPSKDIPRYGVRLKTFHPSFSNVGMGYNRINHQIHNYAEDYTETTNNPLSDAAFQASQANYAHNTSQLTPATLESDEDAAQDSLDAPIFCQDERAAMLALRANMLIYEGETYCSRLHIGAKLNIKDSYISSEESNDKSEVQQDEILLTEVIHSFKANEQYKNTFKGITAAYPHPPYEEGNIFPICSHPVVAHVVDTEDPKKWGRVRLRFPWMMGKYKENHKNGMTPWIHVMQPYTGGENYGTHIIPELYSEVLVMFDNANFERPYVCGSYATSEYPIDSKWYPGDNNIKAIRTSSGHTIEVTDNGGKKGGKIRIYDNQTNNYELIFDTDKKLIKLHSKGNIELNADNDIVLKAGNNVKWDTSKNMEIKATNVKFNTSEAYEVESNKFIRFTSDRAITTKTQNYLGESLAWDWKSSTYSFNGKAPLGGNFVVAGNRLSFNADSTFILKANATLSVTCAAALNLQGTVINMN